MKSIPVNMHTVYHSKHNQQQQQKINIIILYVYTLIASTLSGLNRCVRWMFHVMHGLYQSTGQISDGNNHCPYSTSVLFYFHCYILDDCVYSAGHWCLPGGWPPLHPRQIAAYCGLAHESLHLIKRAQNSQPLRLVLRDSLIAHNQWLLMSGRLEDSSAGMLSNLDSWLIWSTLK